jgi:hypothetical protein
MKKIIIALFFLAGTLGFNNVMAQQKPAAKKTTSKMMAKDSAMAKKTGMKKNGTPDMRYKANKGLKTDTTVMHKKRGGTADMRYKENKTKAKK